jgi:hypothetical protein
MTPPEQDDVSSLLGLDLPELAQAPRIGQIGILVPELAPAIRQWSKVLGSKDWLVFTYDALQMPNMNYHDAPGEFAMQVALIGSNPQIELIQSLRGPNIYDDWLAEHGYGTHHLGFYVDSITQTMTTVRQQGIGILQSGIGYGLNGDGGFAYLDTEASVGVILEAIEVPSVRRPSEPIPV